jgi:hypothetical protein
MDKLAEYHEFAEECRRLAERMPDHKHELMKLAEAWEAVAREETSNRQPRS